MTIRLQACVQSLVFVIMLTATLFGTAGRFDILGFWVYVAIMAGSLGFVPHHSRYRSHAGADAAGRSPCGLAFSATGRLDLHAA